MIKFEELTLGEIEELELLLGEGFDSAFGDGKPKGRALQVLVYIFKRRENADYKFEETKSMTQREAVDFLQGDSKKE